MGAFQGRHALIFAAAPETEYGYIRAFLARHPDALIACADGGLRHARVLGLHPDFMISDCDSMPETEGTEVIRLQPEKDDTDTQSCLPADASTICWPIFPCWRKQRQWAAA